MTIKIEVPADNYVALRIMGNALVALGGGVVAEAVLPEDAPTELEAEDAPETSVTSAPSIFDDMDEKGVRHDDAMCGRAAKPFYGSGKRQGQWKRRQGVTDEAYDAWYAGRVKAVPGTVIEGQQLGGTTELAAEAFAPAATAEAPAAPSDTGALMGWISEKQAAGALVQVDVDVAYSEAGLAIADMFGPAAAANVAVIYGILSQRHGG